MLRYGMPILNFISLDILNGANKDSLGCLTKTVLAASRNGQKKQGMSRQFDAAMQALLLTTVVKEELGIFLSSRSTFQPSPLVMNFG